MMERLTICMHRVRKASGWAGGSPPSADDYGSPLHPAFMSEIFNN